MSLLSIIMWIDSGRRIGILEHMESQYQTAKKDIETQISQINSLENLEEFNSRLESVISSYKAPTIDISEVQAHITTVHQVVKIIIPTRSRDDLIPLLSRIYPNPYTDTELYFKIKGEKLAQYTYGSETVGLTWEIPEDVFLRNKRWFTAEKILEYIDRWNSSVTQSNKLFHSRIEQITYNYLRQRESKIRETNNATKSLGLPIFVRKDVEFVNLKRKVKPLRKSSPEISAPSVVKKFKFKDTDVNAILSVLNSVTLVIESAPSHFNQLDEPAIRFVYLASLNSVFEVEGKGEAFRGKGKTDILISLPEYENAIIIELKKWKGAKLHNDTFLQTKGYRTWRDTNLIEIIIVENQNMSAVIKTARNVVDNRDDIVLMTQEINSGLYSSKHDMEGSIVTVFQLFLHLPNK